LIKQTPSVQLQPSRNLNVHEYVSYTLLSKFGIPVPKFGVAKSGEEAKKVAEDLKTKDLVIKAQVLTGGRGRGHFKKHEKVSGVKLAYTYVLTHFDFFLEIFWKIYNVFVLTDPKKWQIFRNK